MIKKIIIGVLSVSVILLGLSYHRALKREQGEQLIACFGNVTAKCIKENNLRLDLEAPHAGATNMPAALDVFLTENNK